MSFLRIITLVFVAAGAILLAGRLGGGPSDAESRFDQLVEQGQYEQALEFVNKAIAAMPDARGLHERRIMLALNSSSPEAPSLAASGWRLLEERQITSDVLHRALHDRRAATRRNAAQAIELVRLASAQSALEGRVQDPDPDVRTAVVAALGTICQKGCRRAFFPLALALRDPDWRVRAEAASGLGRLGDPRAIPHLARTVLDADSYVRDHAREAMLLVAEPGSALFLAKVLRDVEGTEAEGTIAMALAKAGEPEGYSRVELLMKNPGTTERDKIARTLSTIDVEAAKRLFAGLIDSEHDPEVRKIMKDCIVTREPAAP